MPPLRPLFNSERDIAKDNVKGHIFGAFLALYLSAVLRRRLDDNWRAEHPDQAKDLPAPGQQPARYHVAWDSLMRDLSALRAIRVQLDGELYLLRSEFRGNANDAFQAVGLRPPPLAQKLAV